MRTFFGFFLASSILMINSVVGYATHGPAPRRKVTRLNASAKRKGLFQSGGRRRHLPRQRPPPRPPILPFVETMTTRPSPPLALAQAAMRTLGWTRPRRPRPLPHPT